MCESLFEVLLCPLRLLPLWLPPLLAVKMHIGVICAAVTAAMVIIPDRVVVAAAEAVSGTVYGFHNRHRHHLRNDMMSVIHDSLDLTVVIMYVQCVAYVCGFVICSSRVRHH